MESDGSGVIGVAGSGRADANSTRLLHEALAGAAEAGGGPTAVHPLGHLTFRGCTGCRRCRTDADRCVLDDDLTPVLAATARAPALVFASPNYYGYLSGLAKSYLDRWYAFRDADRNLRTPTGRKALFILTQGHPDPDAYPWTVGSVEKVLAGYGFEPTVFVAAGLEAAGAADARADLLAEARRLGALLPND